MPSSILIIQPIPSPEELDAVQVQAQLHPNLEAADWAYSWRENAFLLLVTDAGPAGELQTLPDLAALFQQHAFEVRTVPQE